ncbi:hypothetical protein CEXT_12821 [Caerostris extrusa]|uniref:Uncharacterized protein n=1 Tax=Caerostris extrusa TaxID=172846 RepID=A0AAV4S305_CAEEX|nr:hypothetical protein CEXT_12821 [Caerostris extrusa]
MGNFREVLGNGHLKNKVTQQSGTLIIARELQLRLVEAVDCALNWIRLLLKGSFEGELNISFAVNGCPSGLFTIRAVMRCG